MSVNRLSSVTSPATNIVSRSSSDTIGPRATMLSHIQLYFSMLCNGHLIRTSNCCYSNESVRKQVQRSSIQLDFVTTRVHPASSEEVTFPHKGIVTAQAVNDGDVLISSSSSDSEVQK